MQYDNNSWCYTPNHYKLLEDGRLEKANTDEVKIINRYVFCDSIHIPQSVELNVYEDFFEIAIFYKYYKFIEKNNIVLHSTFVSNLHINFKTGMSHIKPCKKLYGKVQPKDIKHLPRIINVTLKNFNLKEFLTMYGAAPTDEYFNEINKTYENIIKEYFPQYYSKKYFINIMNWIKKNNMDQEIKNLQFMLDKNFYPETLKFIKTHNIKIMENLDIIKETYKLKSRYKDSISFLKEICKIRKDKKQIMNEFNRLIEFINISNNNFKKCQKETYNKITAIDEAIPF